MVIRTAKDDITNFSSPLYLNVNSCGSHRHVSDGKVMRPSGRVDWHILYVGEGSCRVVWQEEEFLLKAGDFVFYAPGEPQEYCFEKDCGCLTLWVHFSGEWAGKIIASLCINSGVVHAPLSRSLVHSLEKLVAEHIACGYMHKTAENGLLLEILTKMARLISGAHGGTSDIEKTMVYMHEHFYMKYDSQLFAQKCSLSKSRFEHKFREVTGISPCKYFINIKIERAKEMLAFSDMTVAEIAAYVGYDNPLYFSRIFKSYTAISPEKWRRIEKGDSL